MPIPYDTAEYDQLDDVDWEIVAISMFNQPEDEPDKRKKEVPIKKVKKEKLPAPIKKVKKEKLPTPIKKVKKEKLPAPIKEVKKKKERI